MFGLDARYVKRVAKDDDLELEAYDRSAIVLGEWIDGLMREPQALELSRHPG